MKKITLVLGAVLVSVATFAQTISLTNSITTAMQGQEITLDISYDNGTLQSTGGGNGSNAGDFVNIRLQEVDAGFAPVTLFDDIFPILTTPGGGPGTDSFTYTVSPTATPTADLPAGHQYFVVVTLSDFGASQDANFGITITEDPTLSVNEITSSELSDYSYDASSDIITLSAAADYSVYNLAGSIVAEGSSASISLAGLVDGVYIVATENGTTKIIKH